MKTIQHIQRVYYLICPCFGLPWDYRCPLGCGAGPRAEPVEISLLMGVYSLTIVLLEVPTADWPTPSGAKKSR
jgi:hypothetical protein